MRGTIVTHMTQLDPGAAASIGTIKVVQKDGVEMLWKRLNDLLGTFARSWAADVPEARLRAADAIGVRLPATGWLVRALDADQTFIDSGAILAEWPQ